MIDHVSIPVSDLNLSREFYRAVFSTIGLTELVNRSATAGYGKKYPEFWINARPELLPAKENFGAHICLRAPSKETVAAFHKTALEKGGRDGGVPGVRQAAFGPYFGAFIFDLDGNKIEALTFPESGTS